MKTKLKSFFRLLLLLIVLSCIKESHAADLVVRNFKSLPSDQTAINRETMKKDQNGNTAALVKIYTPINPSDLYFDNGVMGIVARENKPGQIWLYIPARSQKIQISTSGQSPTPHYFEEPIESGSTYSMELMFEGKDISIVANVNKAPIFVDGDSVGISPVNTYLSFGDHSIKAQLGYMLYDGNIIVSKDGPSRFEIKMENENDKYSPVSVYVPNEAEIWFDGKRVAIGEWHTRLKEGSYFVELRKRNCEPYIESFNVKIGQPSEIKAKAPIPFKGYLSVEVTPALGTNIFHADTLVAKNRLNRQLNIGDYTYTFKRKGYITTTKTFSVRNNEETLDTVRLERVQYIKKNSLYAGLGITYNSIPGININIGGTYQNISAELGYTLGIGRSGKVYWFQSSSDLFVGATDYSIDELTGKIGYQFSFIQRIGLTPQVGYLGQRLRGGSHGNGAMCHNVTIGAKCIFKPWSHVGIFLTPEFAVPVSVNPLYNDIASHANLSKGGLFITAGLAFSF